MTPPKIIYSTSGFLQICNPTGVIRSSKKRGLVTSFSSASAMRMRRFCKEIIPGKRIAFVTLTLPGDTDIRTRRRLYETYRNFLHSLDADYQSKKCWSCIWRIEYQKNGNPHLHLLFPYAYKSQFRGVFASWCRYVGSSIAGQKLIWSNAFSDSLVCYASKYMAKVGNESDEEDRASGPLLNHNHNRDIDTGRLWGVLGRRLMVFHVLEFFEVSKSDMQGVVNRISAKKSFKPFVRPRGVKLYVNYASTMAIVCFLFWGLLI